MGSLIRLAASLPKGSIGRRRVLAAAMQEKYAAGTEEDIARYPPTFEGSMASFDRAVARMDEKGYSGELRKALGKAVTKQVSLIFMDLKISGFRIAEGILSNRTIPAGKNKQFEMVYRTLAASRSPRDVIAWYEENRPRFEFLIDAAKKWPAKQEGGDDLFTLGPFRVHNTIGLKGAELESFKKAIEQATKAIRSNPVPNFQKTLYGDIHIVAQLRESTTAAWYQPGDDSLYVRKTKAKWGGDEVHSIIHELGHRYYKKFADASSIREWEGHHRVCAFQAKLGRPKDVKIPGVGEELPVKVKGMKGYPKVVEVTPSMIVYEAVLPNKAPVRKQMPRGHVEDFFGKLQQQAAQFPTAYSATSAEEHFCEAVALRATNKLSDNFEIPFVKVWIK